MVSPTDNFTSPKEQIVPTDYDLDGDMPIINEIDNIIDRIKSKYQTQKLSP